MLEGADDHPLLRERLLHGGAVGDLDARTAGQAEVEQLRTRAREDDVAGLEVAVDDARAMRAVERVGDLRAVAEDVAQRQRAAPESVRERLSFEELEDEIGLPCLRLADVVQAADVRMLELGDGLRLALEAQTELRVVRELGGEHLDGHRALETRVARLPHLTHAARTNARDDLVRAEPAADVHVGCGASIRGDGGTGALSRTRLCSTRGLKRVERGLKRVERGLKRVERGLQPAQWNRGKHNAEESRPPR